MAVLLDTPVTALKTSALTTSFSITVAAGRTAIYVVLPLWYSTGAVTGVTWNSIALTRVVQATLSNAQDGVEIWRLSSPSAATANVAVTVNNINVAGQMLAVTTTGQDTTTPEGTPTTATSTVNGTATGTLSVSGAATGDMVLASIANGGGSAVTPTATGGGTLVEIMDVAAAGEECEVCKIPDACTAFSGSWATSTSWAAGLIVLKAAGAAAAFQPYTRVPLLGPLLAQ
jgi:hypothetical protein